MCRIYFFIFLSFACGKSIRSSWSTPPAIQIDLALVPRSDAIFVRWIAVPYLKSTGQVPVLNIQTSYLCTMMTSSNYIYVIIASLHEKNDFAEVSKNLAKCRFLNNFVGLSKLLCRTLKYNMQCCKVLTFYIATSLSVLHNLFDEFNKI